MYTKVKVGPASLIASLAPELVTAEGEYIRFDPRCRGELIEILRQHLGRDKTIARVVAELMSW